MLNFHIIYHDDIDGISSAAIVYNYHKDVVNSTFNFIECSYNSDELPPVESFKKSDIIYIVDYSIPIDYMEKLIYEIRAMVIWIDHHKSAIENYDINYSFEPVNIPGIRLYDTEESAVLLTWKYFYSFSYLNKNIPEAVQLISDYDTWKWSKTNNLNAKYFMYGLLTTTLKNGPMSSVYKNLFYESEQIKKANLFNIIEIGKNVVEYLNVENEVFGQKYAYESKLFDYNVLVINTAHANTSFFESFFHKDYDIYIGWIYTGKEYKVSMFTRKDSIDLSKIAKSLGGGGHKSAAGFSCDKLFF